MGGGDETHAEDAVEEGAVVACEEEGCEGGEGEGGVCGGEGVDDAGEAVGEWGGLNG